MTGIGLRGRIQSAHPGPRTTPRHGEGWGGPDTSEAVTPKRYWARLRADIDRPLRRGAWYHVKKLGPREALLDVLGEAIDVPRPLLDIVSSPPHRWSVVPRPKNPERFPGVTEYGVCPNCRERVPLNERLASLRCRHCHEVFDVAWEEQYFQGV